jgi:hypothetical protein
LTSILLSPFSVSFLPQFFEVLCQLLFDSVESKIFDSIESKIFDSVASKIL